MNRRKTALLSLTALLGAALVASPVSPASADEVEQLKNGTFDSATEPWWTSSNVTAGLSGGQLCADVPGGTANRWDAAVGQNDVTLVKGSRTSSPSPRTVRPKGTSCGRSWGCKWRPTTPTSR